MATVFDYAAMPTKLVTRAIPCRFMLDLARQPDAPNHQTALEDLSQLIADWMFEYVPNAFPEGRLFLNMPDLLEAIWQDGQSEELDDDI